MRFSTWRNIALVALTLVLVFGAMDAQAARRSSLAGNQFINDPDDMFAFPQLLLEYKNRIIIDMGSGGEDDGNGSIVFGENSVWNFNTGRGDYLNNTAFWAWGGADRYFGDIPMNGTPGSNGSSGSDLEWWDLGYATHLGDTPFGVNLSWATDKDKFTPDGADPTQDSKSDMISLQIGTTLNTVQLAGEIGFGSYKDELVGLDPSDMNDYSFFNFSLLARGDLEDLGGLNWRWIAAYANGSNEPKMTDAVKLSTSGFRASFGPVWGTPGEWEVAAYMNFDYVSHDNPFVSSGYDKETEKYTSFPAYNMAMEYFVKHWFIVRGGVASHNASDTYTSTITGGGEDEQQERNNNFMWTLGMGLNAGNFGLDLALEQDDVHSGYLPLNGDSDDEPIAYTTAWVNW